jgi:hypothetical protein
VGNGKRKPKFKSWLDHFWAKRIQTEQYPQDFFIYPNGGDSTQVSGYLDSC